MVLAALALAANLCAAGFLQQVDIPPHGTPQTAIQIERDLAPGESTGQHTHHGVEIVYVLKGTVGISVDGEAPYAVQACHSFLVDRDVPHEITNTGTEPAAMLTTLVIDVGRPVQEPYPADKGH